MKILVAIAGLFVATFATQADEEHLRWTKSGAPSETYITGGGWTLEQSGAAVGLKSAGYLRQEWESDRQYRDPTDATVLFSGGQRSRQSSAGVL